MSTVACVATLDVEVPETIREPATEFGDDNFVLGGLRSGLDLPQRFGNDGLNPYFETHGNGTLCRERNCKWRGDERDDIRTSFVEWRSSD